MMPVGLLWWLEKAVGLEQLTSLLVVAGSAASIQSCFAKYTFYTVDQHHEAFSFIRW